MWVYIVACYLAARNHVLMEQTLLSHGFYRRSAQRIAWGPHALDRLAPELARLGSQRPLLVCGASVRAHPTLLRRVRDALGGSQPAIFDGVRSHTPAASVEQARAQMLTCGADALIAVGGGSALVTARAASMLFAEGGTLEDLATRRAGDRVISPRLSHPKLPIVAIPTTPTTAIVKAGAAVTSPDRIARLALFDPKTRARSILLDPEFLASSPAGLVRNASLNALVMAIEGLATQRSHIFSDAVLIHAGRQLVRVLPELTDPRHSPDIVVEAALASILVGDGTDTTGGGLTAALSHTIGHRYSAHNGEIDAILLPHVMLMTSLTAEAEGNIARALNCTPAQIEARLNDVLHASGAPTRLRDIGVGFDDIAHVVAEAPTDFAYPRGADQPDPAELRDLLGRAW